MYTCSWTVALPRFIKDGKVGLKTLCSVPYKYCYFLFEENFKKQKNITETHQLSGKQFLLILQLDTFDLEIELPAALKLKASLKSLLSSFYIFPQSFL